MFNDDLKRLREEIELMNLKFETLLSLIRERLPKPPPEIVVHVTCDGSSAGTDPVS